VENTSLKYALAVAGIISIIAVYFSLEKSKNRGDR
jgi:hypothetical protein